MLLLATLRIVPFSFTACDAAHCCNILVKKDFLWRVNVRPTQFIWSVRSVYFLFDFATQRVIFSCPAEVKTCVSLTKGARITCEKNRFSALSKSLQLISKKKWRSSQFLLFWSSCLSRLSSNVQPSKAFFWKGLLSLLAVWPAITWRTSWQFGGVVADDVVQPALAMARYPASATEQFSKTSRGPGKNCKNAERRRFEAPCVDLAVSCKPAFQHKRTGVRRVPSDALLTVLMVFWRLSKEQVSSLAVLFFLLSFGCFFLPMTFVLWLWSWAGNLTRRWNGWCDWLMWLHWDCGHTISIREWSCKSPET